MLVQTTRSRHVNNDECRLRNAIATPIYMQKAPRVDRLAMEVHPAKTITKKTEKTFECTHYPEASERTV